MLLLMPIQTRCINILLTKIEPVFLCKNIFLHSTPRQEVSYTALWRS